MVQAQDWGLNGLFGLVWVDSTWVGVLVWYVSSRTFPRGFARLSCDRLVSESLPRNADRSLDLVLMFLSM